MTDGIIIVFLVVVVFAGLRSTVKHFKGEGGCCGGSDYKPKKKKLSKVMYQRSFRVAGMHCEHCKRRVEEAVNDIPGVAGVVNLKKNELKVSYETDVDDELIKSKLERLGYSLSDRI